ncbi:MAG: N-acetylmuramoyl-L-alanine amidase [Rikenellaceae bacterium]
MHILIAFALFAPVSQTTLYAQGVKVIIIDPGHGGRIAPGAVCSGVSEKDLVLDVGLRLGKLLEKSHPDIKLVFTRTTDKALGSTVKEDLYARTALANKSNGDLFISIHANAATSAAASGVETIIMGESSVEQQRNEATLYTNNREELLDMSDEKTAAIVRAYIQNLQFTYGEYSEALARLIQKGYGDYNRKLRPLRRQLLLVLYGVNMPSVLTEIGFMSNKNELSYLTSNKGKDEIAKSIHKGISDYINMVNHTQAVNRQNSAEHASSSQGGSSDLAVVSTPLSRGYTIQLLSARREVDAKDSQFKIYRGDVWYYVASSGAFKYKYCHGRFATRAEAEKELKRAKGSFSDAYIVEREF